jgi:hypothetical protein
MKGIGNPSAIGVAYTKDTYKGPRLVEGDRSRSWALSDKKPAARSAVVASVYEQPVSIFQQLT